MKQSTNFSGKPIISQIISYLDKPKIYRTANKYQSDRYYKKFKTFDHLVCMMYAIMSGCTSLREVAGMHLACQGRLNHLGLNNFPRRSTLSDANKKRTSKVFEDIYYELYKTYRSFLSDSRRGLQGIQNLFIIDSSTITLFSEILKAAGRKPLNGKRKGGVKVHTMINALEDVPSLVSITSSATNDKTFLNNLELKKGSFVVFDKGYPNFEKYYNWTVDGIYFVTRQNRNAVYESVREFDLQEDTPDTILKDEEIRIGSAHKQFNVRRIVFWHEGHQKAYVYISNNFDQKPEIIADIYRKRWQIEVLFKRLKQNFPLKYFLGDNKKAQF
jgi:hypothetical protein